MLTCLPGLFVSLPLWIQRRMGKLMLTVFAGLLVSKLWKLHPGISGSRHYFLDHESKSRYINHSGLWQTFVFWSRARHKAFTMRWAAPEWPVRFISDLIKICAGWDLLIFAHNTLVQSVFSHFEPPATEPRITWKKTSAFLYRKQFRMIEPRVAFVLSRECYSVMPAVALWNNSKWYDSLSISTTS